MNSFLFIQSSNLTPWQNILGTSNTPAFQNSNTLIYANQINHQLTNIEIINSPLTFELPNNYKDNFQLVDSTFLVGIESAILNINLESNLIHIARDFPGTETLYYHLSPDSLIISDNFLSFKKLGLANNLCQLKALEYLTAEFSNSNLTLWDKILKVLPGEIIEFNNYQITSRKKITPSDILSLKFNAPNFTSLINECTRPHLPLAHCELSGGLDSAVIADSLWKISGSEGLKTYSILFPDFICDEEKQINNFLEIRPHHNLKLNFNTLTVNELKNISHQIAYFPDFPNSLSSLPYLKIIHSKNQKVLIDGFGGDQLFNIWKVKKVRTIFDLLKSKLLNDFKLRLLFRKRIFPWIPIDFECEFLGYLYQNPESYPQTSKPDQLAMLQQLFSPEFSEYLESACLVAKSQNIYRSHPLLRKSMIAFALNLNINDRTHKQFLKLYLQDSLGSKWKGSKKADFSETFQAYYLQNEYQEIISTALSRFANWLQPKSLPELSRLTNSTSKQLLINWNLVGLKVMEDTQSC